MLREGLANLDQVASLSCRRHEFIHRFDSDRRLQSQLTSTHIRSSSDHGRALAFVSVQRRL